MKAVLEMQRKKIQRPDEDLMCAIRSSLLKQDTPNGNFASQTNAKTTENLAAIPQNASKNEPSPNGRTKKGCSLVASINVSPGEQNPEPDNAQKLRKEGNFLPTKLYEELASGTPPAIFVGNTNAARGRQAEPARLADKKPSTVLLTSNAAKHRGPLDASERGSRSTSQPVARFSFQSRPTLPKVNDHAGPSATVVSRSPSAIGRNTSRLRARTIHKDAGLMSAVRATMGEQPPPEEADLAELQELRRSMVLRGTSPHQFAGVDYEDRQVMTALQTSLQEVKISDLTLHERPLTKDTECAVCTDVFSPSEIAMGFISIACDHSSPEVALQYTCKGCVQRHLDVQVQSGASTLTCPICLAELTYYDVKKWATPRTFTRYDRLRTRDAITSDPNFIWCTNPSCDAGQVHGSGSDAPIVVCNYCGTKTCFNHQQGWHDGFSCAEFDDPQIAEERIRREQEEIEAIERQQREEERRIRGQVERDEEIARAMAAEEDRRAAERKAIEIRIQREAEERRRRDAEEAERKRRETEKAKLKKEREERAKRLQEEKAGEEAVMNSTKLCPGPKCTYRVHKVDGCKHMTCVFPFPSTAGRLLIQSY